jgi:separase
VKIAGKEAPTLQLENGILALVGKLVAHHLDHLAIKELGVLKRRLDNFLGGGKTTQEERTTNSKIRPKKTTSEKESLASLLDFGDIDRTSPALPIVITHQTYVLRMIARIRRPSLVEEAWNCLKLSCPSSPGTLIWHMAKASNGDPKIARQLESLSQTALSLCPSISSSEDVSADQEMLQPRPDLVLSLQHFAFKMRQRWWTLAKHQANEEKELLEPFSKCVVAFARRSRLSALKKYKVAELLSTDLLGPKDLSALSQRYKRSPALAVATQCLSSLAQSAGLPDEALRWLGDSESSKQAGDTVAKTTIRLMRIATITLDAVLSGETKSDSEEVLTNALNALSSSLGGSSSELDSLFMEVNALRRVAAKLLSTTSQANELASPTRLELLRVVSAGVHFSARYLGPMSAPDNEAKTQARLRQRILAVAKYVKSIVDSVCVCSKLSVSCEPEEHLKSMERLFLDCIAILQHIQESDVKLPDDLQHPYVKLSNAYWTVHLQLKAAEGTFTQSILAMEKSIELLRLRPHIEQQSGLLDMKLERLAEALGSANRVEDSRKAFIRCLQSLTASDAMQNAIEFAKVHPISRAFEDSENSSTIGRVLKTYHRSFLKDGAKEPNELAFFDNAELLAAGRGLLLEWQLVLFLKGLSRNRSWNPALNPSVQAIATRLLEIYEPSNFPIRRRRVQIMLLQVWQLHPEILSHAILQFNDKLDFSISSTKTQDQGLAKYDPHLKALLRLKLSMLESLPSITTIRECCSVWQTLVDSAPSWSELCNQLDDVEVWLNDLRKAADQLNAKGEEYVGLPVLQLLVRVQELEKHVDPSQLITDLCTLSVQFLRLGYSGKAGLMFTKSETLMSDKNASTLAKLQWHLGYAEYLLEIGNPAKW